jgi:hypothetical protein
MCTALARGNFQSRLPQIPASLSTLSSGGHKKAPDQRWSGASQICLPLDADAEIQVDVLAGETVLEVLGEARVGRCVGSRGDGSTEEGLRVGGPEHIQRREPEVASGDPLDVGPEGPLVVVAG